MGSDDTGKAAPRIADTCATACYQTEASSSQISSRV